jgi:hypothetical protein
MRAVFAFLSGGLFGAGLFVSGMTDTTKVQGWLDIFGAWDPTLAFVLGGAILPMLVAWRIHRGAAQVGAGQRPARAARSAIWAQPGPRLGTLFGMGWGLAGLCPGPAMASLGWGGDGVVRSSLSRCSPVWWRHLRSEGVDRCLPLPERTLPMDIRRLSPGYAVSPADRPAGRAATLKAQGFATVICNRPDAEVPPGQRAADACAARSRLRG